MEATSKLLKTIVHVLRYVMPHHLNIDHNKLPTLFHSLLFAITEIASDTILVNIGSNNDC